MFKVIIILLVNLFYLTIFIGFPYFCCLGIIYGGENRKDAPGNIVRLSIRVLSFIGFIFYWGLLYALNYMNPSDIHIITLDIYEVVISPILPLIILSIVLLYAIFRKKKKMVDLRYYILFIIGFFVLDWQYLTLIQIEPGHLTKIQQGNAVVYIMNWSNLVPFIIVNLSFFSLIGILLIRKKICSFELNPPRME